MWSDEELDEVPHGRTRLRGWAKYDLIDKLVEGDLTQKQLAERYGVTQQAINNFKTRNLAIIEARQKDAADEFAGMWVAKKKNRVLAYQHDIDIIDDMDPDPQWARIKHAALKSVAEELGQLKTYIDAESRVNYTVDGVDMDKLQ